MALKILVIYLLFKFACSFNYRNYLEEIDLDICKRMIKPSYNEGDIHFTEMFGYAVVLYHTLVMLERKEMEGFLIGSVLNDHKGPRLLSVDHNFDLYEKLYNWNFGEMFMLLEIQGIIPVSYTHLDVYKRQVYFFILSK